MKKQNLFLFLLLVLFIPSAFLLTACGDIEKTSQTSTMSISSVYQNVWGGVFVVVDNVEDYYSSSENLVEISCDNGTTWFNYYPDISTEDVTTGVVVTYDVYNNYFYNYSNGNITTYTVGTELHIVIRLKETETKLASDATAVYNYTIKALAPNTVSMFDKFGAYSYTGDALTGSLEVNTMMQYGEEEVHSIYFDNRFEYVNNEYQICVREFVLCRNGNTIRIGTLDVDYSDRTFAITLISTYGEFEYRYVNNDSTTESLITDYNQTNYDSENWITLTSAGMTFDNDDLNSNTGTPQLAILIRLKETATTVYSICYYNYFIFE